MNASPGGSISAFCEPVISTSMPHASMRTSVAPTAVMPSTTSRVSDARVSAAISRTGCSTVVEVSLACINTALVSGRRASATASAETACPHSTLISCMSRPVAAQMFSQRSPNFPPLTTTTRSPGEHRLATAASIAPEPEADRVSTGWPVWNSQPSPSWTSRKSWLNSGVRWWINGCDMRNATSGGTCVGPGVSK